MKIDRYIHIGATARVASTYCEIDFNEGVNLQNTNAEINGKKLQLYQQNQIMSMEPIRLLIKVYDYTILQCKKHDEVRASKGLVELIAALNFDYQEVSLGLFRLYQYCMDKIKQKEFDEAVYLLQGLRDAWAQTSRVLGTEKRKEPSPQ